MVNIEVRHVVIEPRGGPGGDVGAFLDDLWCLVCRGGKGSTRTLAEAMLDITRFFNNARYRAEDGTYLPDQQFDFYVRELEQAVKKQ